MINKWISREHRYITRQRAILEVLAENPELLDEKLSIQPYGLDVFNLDLISRIQSTLASYTKEHSLPSTPQDPSKALEKAVSLLSFYRNLLSELNKFEIRHNFIPKLVITQQDRGQCYLLLVHVPQFKEGMIPKRS